MKAYLKSILLISALLVSYSLSAEEKGTDKPIEKTGDKAIEKKADKPADFKEDVNKLKNNINSDIDQIKEKSKTDIEKAKPEIKKSAEKSESKTELFDQADNEPIKTIIGTNKFRPGGYGAPVLKLSQIGPSGNDIGYFFGLRTGFIMNHHFSIGLGANIMFNPLDRARVGQYNYTGTDSVCNMAYGGLLLEYYIFPKSIVNVSIGVLIGGGAMVFQDGNYWQNVKFNPHVVNGFFAVEPEVNVFLNVSRFFRIGVGATYRYVNGIKDVNVTDKAFTGFGGHLMLQFGWF